MKNKRYVEGSICDAYLIEETTHFASFYFEDHVQSRPMGAKSQRYLDSKERFTAHKYILLNCEDVQPILRLYETGLRQYNPGATTEDIDQEVERSFASWFRDYVYNPANNVCNQALIDLACGPLMQATTYNGFEPHSAHRRIIECIQKAYPQAIKSFKAAPQYLKDVWFNEFKKDYRWDPLEENTIRRIFEKKSAKLLTDHLREVRVRLADENKTKPHWIADDVLDDLVRIWESEDFKKLSKKNKSNRNSNSGGLGASLHSFGSIPMTEHRRRLDTMNELRQTQTEASDAELWLEATSGVKRGGYVYGFGSPLNPDYDSDYAEFLAEFLADDSLGDTPPASPATPDTIFPASETDRLSPPSQTPSMVSADSPATSA
nr:putative transposase En/Spm [Ipomoea trifida]